MRSGKKMKITVPVSDLFIAHLERFSAFTEAVELKRVGIFVQGKYEFIFHSGQNLLDHALNCSFNEAFFDYLKENKVTYLSLDLGPACEKVEVVNKRYIACSSIMNREKAFRVIERNLSYIKKYFTGRIAVENLNYYRTGAYELVCDPAFINEAVKRFGIKLLLDLAHAKISAFNIKIDHAAYLDDLPLEEVIEVHLSQPSIAGDEMVDAHGWLEDRDFEEFKALLEHVQPEYVAIEHYRELDKLIENYKKLKGLLNA